AYLESLGLLHDAGGNTTNRDGTGQSPCSAAHSGDWWYGGYCGGAEGQVMANSGGFIPVSLMDPDALALISSFPKANATPTSAQPFNFNYLSNTPVNRWEYRV